MLSFEYGFIIFEIPNPFSKKVFKEMVVHFSPRDAGVIGQTVKLWDTVEPVFKPEPASAYMVHALMHLPKLKIAKG